MTTNQIKEIITYRKRGSSYRVISELMGCSKSTVAHYVKQAGMKNEKPCYEARAFSDEDEQKINREYQAGSTMVTLALKYNCSESTVHRAILRQGGKMREPHRCRVNRFMLLHDWQTGETPKQLYKRYGFRNPRMLNSYISEMRRQGMAFGYMKGASA